jgi:hypothetical protein
MTNFIGDASRDGARTLLLHTFFRTSKRKVVGNTFDDLRQIRDYMNSPWFSSITVKPYGRRHVCVICNPCVADKGMLDKYAWKRSASNTCS